MSKFILDAIKADASAKEAKALANLNNYLTNGVGVGEHPDVVTECVKLVKEVAEAQEVLLICDKLFQVEKPEDVNEKTVKKS